MPLLVLTADRPPELRELGAGQTIDQVKLYGSAAKWFLEVDDQPATPERMRWLRQLACRAFWTALEGRPGPVHLNFALREPLVLDEPLGRRPGGGGRAGGRPWVTRPRIAARAAPALLDGLRAEVDAPPARGDRRRPLRARPRAGRGAGRVRRLRRAAAARRPAVRRPPRPGGDRALRRAAARRRVGGRARARPRPPRRRPPDLEAAAPLARRARRRAAGRASTPRTRGRTRPAPWRRSSDRPAAMLDASPPRAADGPRLARALARAPTASRRRDRDRAHARPV